MITLLGEGGAGCFSCLWFLVYVPCHNGLFFLLVSLVGFFLNFGLFLTCSSLFYTGDTDSWLLFPV